MVYGLTFRRYLNIVLVQRAFGDPYWEEVRSKFDDLSFCTKSGAKRKIGIGQCEGAKGRNDLIFRIICKTSVNVCRTSSSGKNPEYSSVSKVCHPRDDELTLLALL